MPIENDELILRAQAGDRGAYDEVVRRFQKRSIAYAFSVLGDYQLAEDATQEAFLSAYLDLMKLRDVKAFPGWLRRIVNNHAIDVLRKDRLRTTAMTPDLNDVAGRESGPRAQARQREIAGMVGSAIESLPEGEASVARMFFLEQARISEIAARLGLTDEATKSRLRRARTTLQQSLVGLVDAGRKYDMKTNSTIRKAATEEAIEQLRAERERLAKTTAQDQQRMTKLMCAEGRLERFMGRTERALKLFTEGLRSVRPEHDPAIRARLRTEIGISQVKLAQYAQAERALKAAEAELKAKAAEGMAALRPAILNGLGTCAWGKGNFARARKLWDQAVEASRVAKSPAQEAAALNNVSLIDWKRGDLSRAVAGFKRCRTQWQRIGNRHGLAQTLVNVGILEENLGNLAAANEQYRKALQLAKELRFVQLEAVVYSNMANLALVRGEWDQARRNAQQAIELARQTKDRRSEAIAQENRALGLIGLKAWDEAAGALTAGRKLAEAIGDQERQFSLDLVEIELWIETGEHTAALKRFRALEKVLKRREFTGEEARLQRLWAHAELGAGQTAAARRRVELALGSSRTQGNRSEEKRVLMLSKRIDAARDSTASKKTKVGQRVKRRTKDKP